ncbi:hypothetical protein MKS83_20830 [Chryseobacterium sp. Y16C]|uniref:hypothetical protein n=1 Tax=Chryseobacterium sp. Y16C TaxID=2920939 RepID=UPI001F0A6B68|nr:hypothetical protein [Chryseobacterium sp. Y16C]UMQ41816.1 hypothetical protein MKS83_20830 [Chryseobacterium sp. Y16C]
MKVIVYNINQEEKELLALANRKTHKITIITDPLNENTVHFAEAKDVVIIIHQENQLSHSFILKLISLGIQYLILKSKEEFFIDLPIIKNSGIQFHIIKCSDPRLAASLIIKTLDGWENRDQDHMKP